MTKNLIRLLLSLSLGLLISCEANESKETESASKEGNNEDCFMQLHPGKVKGGEMESVIFQHGACLGKYKALNKYSKQSYLYAMPSADSTDISVGLKSKIIVGRDGVASIKNSEGTKAIGRMIGKAPDIALVLDNGVEFNLIISESDGGFKLWELGDGQGARKTEEIAIYIP